MQPALQRRDRRPARLFAIVPPLVRPRIGRAPSRAGPRRPGTARACAGSPRPSPRPNPNPCRGRCLGRRQGGVNRSIAMTEKLVVVGAGMASGRVLEHLLDDAPGRYDITLFGAEPRGNYNRIMLSPVLSGEKTYDEIVTHDAAWYARHGITTRFGETVTKIDRAAKVVHAKGGETPYDRLLIATGSAPFIIPVPGRELTGVMAYRDLDDVHAMMAAAETPGARAVVIGGGLLGLEAAAGLKARGMEVTVLHLMGHLMERQLDPAAGYLLQKDPRAPRHPRPLQGLDQGDPRPRARRRGAARGRHRVSGRHRGDGRRHPPRDPHRHRRPSRGQPRHRRRRRACRPPTSTSSPSASASSTTAPATASSRRSTTWRRSRRRRSSASRRHSGRSRPRPSSR